MDNRAMDIASRNQRPPTGDKLRIVNQSQVARVLDSNGRVYCLRPEAGTPVHYVAGTAQVDTATVTAASGATSNGNLVVTVAAAGMAGSPLAINVPLTTAANTAALVAAQVRSVLGATMSVTAMFTVGGTGATATLTRSTPTANDTTLNIGIAAGLGVSAAASSANTTAGVARVLATTASAGDQLIDASFLYTARANVETTSTSGWYKSAVASV